MRDDERMFQRTPGTRLCKNLLYKRFVDSRNKFDRELRIASKKWHMSVNLSKNDYNWLTGGKKGGEKKLI